MLGKAASWTQTKLKSVHLRSKPRMVTNESIANDGRMVPAALDLPYGKLFFGFTYKPYDPKAAGVKKVEPEDGAGVSLISFL
jgi:hypothetical protein